MITLSTFFIHLSKHTAMYTKLLVADARSILLGKFLGYSYDDPNHGRYFRVEEVKKKGRYFLVSGSIDGCYGEVRLTAADIVWLEKHHESEFESTLSDGKKLYKKYVLS